MTTLLAAVLTGVGILAGTGAAASAAPVDTPTSTGVLTLALGDTPPTDHDDWD